MLASSRGRVGSERMRLHGGPSALWVAQQCLGLPASRKGKARSPSRPSWVPTHTTSLETARPENFPWFSKGGVISWLRLEDPWSQTVLQLLVPLSCPPL